MRIGKKIIAACLFTFCLAIAVLINSGPRGDSVKFDRRLGVGHYYSNLEQDQKILAADMRRLRRDLRHRAGDMMISAEREAVRQDWLDIVIDRGLNRDPLAPALLDMAREGSSRAGGAFR